MPHYGIKSTAGHHHLRVVCAPKFNRTEGQSKISGNKTPSVLKKAKEILVKNALITLLLL